MADSKSWDRSNFWTRRATRRRVMGGAAAGGIGLAALAAVGCGDDDDGGGASASPTPGGATTPTASPISGGNLKTRAYNEGPQHFDVFSSLNRRVQGPAQYVYDSLLSFKNGPEAKKGGFELEGHLAQSWQIPDSTTYLLKLRPGVKFHNKAPVNGRELTGEDVVYSLKRRMDPKSVHWSALYNQVDSIDLPDATTVRIKMKAPFAPGLAYLAGMHATIVAKEVAEKGSLEPAESAIGTGPWMVDSFEPKVRFKAVRNPNWFKGQSKPYLASFEDITVAADGVVAALSSGQLDFAHLLSWGAVKPLKDNKSVQITKASPQTSIRTLLGFRVDLDPFKDKRVRQAISMCIDRDGILTKLFEGYGYQNGTLPKGFGDLALPLDKLGNGSKYYKRNVADAKALLGAAGFGDGFETKITSFNIAPQDMKDEIDVVIQNMAEIGIKAKVEYLEYVAAIGLIHTGKMEAIGYTSAGGRPEPDSLLFGVYHSTDADQKYSSVKDPDLDKMLVAQRQELDTAKRKQLIADIQIYLAEQQYIVHLPSSDLITVVGQKVEGWGRGTPGAEPFGDLLDPFLDGIAYANLWKNA